jgi:hypothetical protein
MNFNPHYIILNDDIICPPLITDQSMYVFALVNEYKRLLPTFVCLESVVENSS